MNIVNSIKNGDQVIFQQVFIEYHEKLYAYILKKTHSTYLAEEVVQITFIKLWDNRLNLNEDYSISTQLFRIATTTLIDLIRKKNTSELLVKKIVEKDNNNNTINDIIGKLEAKELNNKIEKALETLPPIRRKVFKMSRFEEMSYTEIASELKISTKTVENHISRALKQLRPFLGIILIILVSYICFNNLRLGVQVDNKRIKSNKVFPI